MASECKTIKTACRGCHGGCIHFLTIEDGRIIAIEPDPSAPLSHGRACAKGRTIIEQSYHPDRILHPLRRIGPRGSGQWERITWDEAYDTIAQNMGHLRDTYGPECLSTVTGTGRHLNAHLLRFNHVLGTPNGFSTGAFICLGPRRTAGIYTAGLFAGADYFGDTKPGGMIVWGTSPDVSGPDGELQWFIKDAVKRGTPMLVVDPFPTMLAQKAEIWLRIRPGTDGALALGILNILITEELYDHDFVENWTYGFAELKERCAQYDIDRVAEITGLDKNDILRAARWIAGKKPLAMEWGPASEQSTNAFQTCRAIFMIPAITGNWDIPGGFVESQEIAPTADPLFERMTPEIMDRGLKRSPLRFGPPFAHPYAALEAMRKDSPGRIRGLFAHASNVLLCMADSRHTYDCLKDLDYFVCMDMFMTPTAELADIVLPAALWPEVNCLFCMPEFGDQAILSQQKAVQVGECISDEAFFLEISRRMGLDYGAVTEEEILDGILAEMGRRRPEYAGLRFDTFKDQAILEPERQYYNYKTRNGFATPSGKFEFYSLTAREDGVDPLPFWKEIPESPVSRPDLLEDYPIILTTGKRQQQFFLSNNRQIRSLRRTAPFPLVSINPDTAARYGIAQGDWVFIETRRGKITQKADLVPEMAPNVINCELGWWYPEDPSPLHGCFESNVNVLTDGAPPYDEMGAYQLRGLMCRISKNPSRAIEERYYNSPCYATLPVDDSSPSIVLDPNQCILCGSCVDTCARIQTVGALEIVTEGGDTFVRPRGGGLMKDSALCVGCGQCAAACPTGAIRGRSDLERLKDAIADPDTLVAAQIAPSVRVALGEAMGLPRGENVLPALTAALKKAGIDEIYDTVFSADLTVVEETEEFLRRLKSGKNIPLFTSCCPAWVSFCEKNFPELSGHISTTRSPQQMLAAVMRAHYDAPENRRGHKNVLLCSVMPCTAKKAELLRSESETMGRRDLDFSVTTVEIAALLREAGLDLSSAGTDAPAEPFGEGTGGGTLFGITGGVTEAVIRHLLPAADEETLQAVSQCGVRGPDGEKIFTLDYEGRTLRMAVVSGLGNARRLMERMQAGESFDFVEVMACPGGCVMGGGQPHDVFEKRREWQSRSQGLFRTDEASPLHSSGQNPWVQKSLQEMNEETRRRLLHRNLS